MLETIVSYKRREVTERKARIPLETLQRSLPEIAPVPFRQPLEGPGVHIIAEVKYASPSRGDFPCRLAPVEVAGAYAEHGAAAVSVLTEPSRFGGDLSHLREVAALLAGVGIPAMRKDFLVDPAQVLEARAAGAGGVLLIAAMLDDAELAAMLDCALEHALFVLLEAFDEADLERIGGLVERPAYGDAAVAGRLLVGVNTRNLRTLEVDGERLAELAGRLPPAARHVAESGLETAADAARAADLGYSVALVGSALMRHDDPSALLRDMCHAGRVARAAVVA